MCSVIRGDGFEGSLCCADEEDEALDLDVDSLSRGDLQIALKKVCLDLYCDQMHACRAFPSPHAGAHL